MMKHLRFKRGLEIHAEAPPLVGLTMCSIVTGPPIEHTDEPVTCKNCRKAIEMVARRQLQYLSAQGMEKILDIVAQMRNGDFKDEKTILFPIDSYTAVDGNSDSTSRIYQARDYDTNSTRLPTRTY